jgi:hypothetical protein
MSTNKHSFSNNLALTKQNFEYAERAYNKLREWSLSSLPPWILLSQLEKEQWARYEQLVEVAVTEGIAHVSKAL